MIEIIGTEICDKKSIYDFYGVKDVENVICESVEFQEDVLPDNVKYKVKIQEDTQEVFMIIAEVNVESTYDRRMAFSKVLQRRYGVCCEDAIDQQYTTPLCRARVGAVVICANQLEEILKVLYSLSFCGFGVFVDKYSAMTLAKQLIQVFQRKGKFYEILSVCCNIVLSNKAKFIHVHNGCDGFSITQFYRRIGEVVESKG